MSRERNLQGALLSFRIAPPCTSLNCVCGTEVRSSRIAFSAPRVVVDGSGNGITILSCTSQHHDRHSLSSRWHSPL